MRELQRQIDVRLKKAVSTENRLVVIHDLMMESFLKLDNKLKSLSSHLHDFCV